ncbi:MAG: hypothetical protein E7614_00820 [Ruminococcaceae bacterium]|nr:hypothetical protein [Oscillospiraceae bacterium]
MKNKKVIIFVVACVLAFGIMSAFVIFTVNRSSEIMTKEREYLEVYQIKAEEYIKSNAEIINKHGNNFFVEFYDTISYKPNSDKGFLERTYDSFWAKAPETIESFVLELEEIYFEFEINEIPYELIFSKNNYGELFVSSLKEVEK